SIFCAPSQKFQILSIPNVLAHGSYEHGFVKKYDSYKVCSKSCTNSSFDRFFLHCLINSKILAIPNVLAHGKSYEHGFAKKRGGHSNILAHGKSNRVLIIFSCTILEIQNTGHSQRISPWEVV
ncbi:hypothetical protein B296_00050079, partial [Ensete ventricosum]